MSYHNTPTSTPSTVSTTQSTTASTMPPTTNALGQAAPAGYHYMADGILMADSDMINQSVKVISGFDLDLSALAATTSIRQFSVLGDNGAVFNLEIKNEDNYYYNFLTLAFQATKSGLYDAVIYNNAFKEEIYFPTITDNDQYDISLSVQPTTTKHADYSEVRFGDGSIDINSSTGSNSLLMTKVIYQYVDQTLTISPYSVGGTVETGSIVSDTIALSRGLTAVKQTFSISCAVSTAAKCYRIIKQPVSNDVISFIEPVVGDTPTTIEGEDIYPAVNNTDIVDGTGFAAGTSTKLVMNTNVADKMAVGDKITIATTDLTDTINGAVSSGVKVVMDSNVATKMAVGDRITAAVSGEPHALLRASSSTIVTVAALNPDGDNAKEFSMSQAVSVSDGEVLTFTPKCNRELFTVAEFNPDGDNVKEFAYVDAAGGTSSRLGVMDNAVLSFSNRRNYRWPISSTTVNLSKIKSGMRQVKSSFFATAPVIRDYVENVTILEGEVGEKTIEKVRVPAIDTLGIKPIITRDATTKVVTTTVGTSSNPINITFDQQASLAFGGVNAKIFSYGERDIQLLTGYEVEFSDLNVALRKVSTTTTSAVSASTSVPVTQRAGIMDVISSVSGIGIDAAVANPTVASGAGSVVGAGTIVLSAAQTLENGITLTFPGGGTIVTVTGKIKVNNMGNEDITLSFDLEKFLTMH